MRKFLILVFALSLTTPAWGALQEIIENYRGIRSLGMGGVFATTGIYDEALFGNPAMQLEDPNWRLSLLDITLETDTNLISDYSKINSARTASGSGVPQQIANSGLAGRPEHERLTLLMPAFYSPHFFGQDTSFAIGLLVNEQATLILNQDASVDVQAMVGIGPNFGVAHRFLDGMLDVGFNGHFLYRMAGDPSINAASFLTGQKIALSSIAGQGLGLDFDLGAYYKLPFAVPFFKRLSVGASLNNILQSRYQIASSALASNVHGTVFGNDRTGALGVRGDMPDCLFMRDNLFSIEFQNIGTTQSLASFWKKLHMGGETHVTGILFVRGGINEGYLGGGLGLDLPLFKFDVATYGEELGANTGRLEDRRVAARFALDL